MFLRHALGSLLILAAGVLPCTAQMRPTSRTTFTIRGSVHDDSSQLQMQNVRVDLKMGTGTPVNFTFTNTDGGFEFDGLSRGDYIIEVSAKNYEPVQQRITVAGIDAQDVYISLNKAMTVVENSGASISAHELSVPAKAHEEYVKGLDLMFGKSDYKAAIVQFQRATRDFPTFYEAYAQEGSAYMYLGEGGPGEEALRKSVDLSSGRYSYALFILAGLLTDAKRYTESVTFAQQGITADSASWQGPFEVARALLGLRQMEEARKYALQARDMKPDNPIVYLLLANIFIVQHDYPALLKDLDAYLKLVPSGPGADQARKTRENLQAAMAKEENESPASAGHTIPAAPVIEPPPPPDPDTSGLPSLPPPAQAIRRVFDALVLSLFWMRSSPTEDCRLHRNFLEALYVY